MRNLKSLFQSVAVAAVVAAGCVALTAAPAMARDHRGHGGYHNGYSGGYSGGHGYYRGGYRGGHSYYRGRSNTSIFFGFSGLYGAPYYSGYYGDPFYSGYYGNPYSSGYYGGYPPTVVQQPVYSAPPQDQSNYQPSAYVAPPPPAGNCLQQREYQTTIVIGGKHVPAYGTACLQPDGSWNEGPAQPEQ